MFYAGISVSDMNKIYIIVCCLIWIIAGFSINNPVTPYQFPELRFFPEMPVPENNPVTKEGVDLGRYLFYDPILSLSQTMSCASCHRQGKAFSDAPQIFSKGKNEIPTKRNAMPLFNLAWYPSLFWDGRAASIEDQVLHPVADTGEMNLPWTEAARRVNNSPFYKPKFKVAFGEREIDSVLIAKAIGQFLRTLISHQSKYDRVLAGEDFLTKDEYDGFVLMNDMTKGNCLHCHTTDADVLGTTRKFSNNGLDPINDPLAYRDKGLGGFTNNLEDNGKFKIPSLRNVELTAPYMHDGRFATLEEVLNFYSEGVNQSANVDSKMRFAHPKGVGLTKNEQYKIIVFLKTLTDSSFIANPAFSKP